MGRGNPVPRRERNVGLVREQALDRDGNRKSTMKLPKNANRRSVLKTIGTGAMGAAALTGAGSVQSKPINLPPPKIPPAKGRMWGSDGTNNWIFNDTGIRPETAHAPFYVLDWIPAGSCTGDSPDFAPNHVAPTPGRIDGDRFNANWHVHFVTGDSADRPDTITPSAIENSDLTIIPLCVDLDTDPPTTVPCFNPDADRKVIFTCAVKPKDCPE